MAESVESSKAEDKMDVANVAAPTDTTMSMETAETSTQKKEEENAESSISLSREEDKFHSKSKRSRNEKNDDTDARSSKGEGPNSFLSIPITNSETSENIAAIQKFIVECDPMLKPLLINLPTLHITLGVFSLKNVVNELESCKEALEESKRKILDFGAKFPLSINVEGVGSFSNRVLYAKVTPSDDLKVVSQMSETLMKVFEDKGIKAADSLPFKPHITIMKLSRGKFFLKKNLKEIIEKIEAKYENEKMGSNEVNRVDLCWMRRQAHSDGYYNIIHQIKLDQPSEAHFESDDNTKAGINKEKEISTRDTGTIEDIDTQNHKTVADDDNSHSKASTTESGANIPGEKVPEGDRI
ncbi:hypothetical protein HELRODRAFT_165273 [Helobdella robusta]|uniref:A-kinase anchor protein 7-like phosphoesterase domain-containing protein n=1 Tax=Helobdella robusta TaxID=6412 RepID=T1EWJ0_HELRO|nr:hypothetical protein HELRODRAFT_165273 [Helobdella robusta]ESN93112.1 hypothetical protein HELRODRAFT_165273 [Helobdella robusta]